MDTSPIIAVIPAWIAAIQSPWMANDRLRQGSGSLTWKIVYRRQAQKDAKILAAAGMKSNARTLLELLSEDRFRHLPTFEKLVGDLKGVYSRHINIQHRVVYQVLEKERVVKVLRLWPDYE